MILKLFLAVYSRWKMAWFQYRYVNEVKVLGLDIREIARMTYSYKFEVISNPVLLVCVTYNFQAISRYVICANFLTHNHKSNYSIHKLNGKLITFL